ncbi:MAG: amidohydrolase family protein [Bryobacteraceae bacterium]
MRLGHGGSEGGFSRLCGLSPRLVVAGAMVLLGAARPVAIRHVTVIDATGAPAAADRTVILQGERIAAIGPAAAVRAPKNAVIVNGRGKYLIPGLWDMDVHLWDRENPLPVFVAFGVTGVRDMGSNLARTLEWRNQIETGKAPGPHIITCGPDIDGGDSHDEKLPTLKVRTPTDARRIFDYLYDQQVDFIGILPSLPRFAYLALIEQGRHWGIPIAGALPYPVSAWDAVAARQSSIERLDGLFRACSTEEDELESEWERAFPAGNTAALERIGNRALDTFSEKKADDLLRKCALFGTRQTPVLTSFARAARLDADAMACDARYRYVARAAKAEWTAEREPVSSELLAYRRKQFDRAVDMVRRMRSSGVAILAGSGSGDPLSIPGATLHDELQLLVSAGLTPMEALRSATIEPAKYLGWDDALGTIETGKVADLVLLNANPLDDIANTQKIAVVVLRGKVLGKAQLARILEAVK